MKQQWKAVTLTGILALACTAYTWGIPAVVNIKAHKNFIEQKIFENTGYITDLGNPNISMGAFPSVWLESDNISILNDDKTKALSVDNPRLKINLFPLIMKRIVISKISADKEDIYFILNKNNEFLLGQYPLKNNPDNKFTVTKADWNLGEYNIYLDDKQRKEKVKLEGEHFQNGKYVKNKNIKFDTKGKFYVGDNFTPYNVDISINLPINRFSEDKFKIIANIENFDLSSISNYVKIISNGKITSLKGKINFIADTKTDKYSHKNIYTTLTSENLEIKGKDDAQTIECKDKLNAKIDFDTIENGINFENFVIDSNKIHLKANGKVFNLGEKIPNLALKAQAQDTRTENVIKLLPWSETLLPDFNLYKLKKYVLYANGQAELTFKGKGNRPFVNGEAKLTDAYLIKPLKGAPKNADVDLKFKDQLMNLNVFVPTGVNQNVVVKGRVKIDGTKYSELQIKSTEAVSIAEAQEVLNPLHEILKFQLGPVPMMKISGLGNIDMHSAGRKVDPHLWGKINFKNAKASFNDIHNLAVENGSGEVVFNDTLTTFKTYNGYINGKPVEIKGDCTVLGKLNVFISSKNQNIPLLIKTINTSPILKDVQKVVSPFTKPTGTADVNLNIYGTAKNAEEVVFNKDIFSKGTITLHNVSTVMQDTYLPFTKVNGVVNFDQYNSDYDVNGYVRNSKLSVKGTGNQSEIDLTAVSDKFAIADCTDLLYPKMNLPYQKEIGKINTSFSGYYKGTADANKLDYNKIIINGKFFENKNTNNPIKTNGGTFTIKNGILKTSRMNGTFNNNPFILAFTIKNIFDKMIISDADFNFKNFDLNTINSIKNQVTLPAQLAKQADNISGIQGIIDIRGIMKNGNIYANTSIKNTKFTYKPIGAVVKVLNGDINAEGNSIYLKKINTLVSSMPVFVDGSMTNIFKNPDLNVFVSAKPNQYFFEHMFNEKSVYPVKIKGDVNFNTNLRGNLNKIYARSNLNIGENSSIYYMGATISGAPSGSIGADGITTNPVTVYSDTVLFPNKIKINSLSYNQTLTSQNKRQYLQNQLNVSGEISLLKNNILGFKNLKIKTSQPTNARIFNILTKKPTIKQGVFTSDLTINGTSAAPYIIGPLNITSVDIPLLDATIRDINIDFQKDYINLMSKGTVLTNDILTTMKIINKPNPPLVVEDAQIQMEELNLNILTEALNDFDVDNTRNKIQLSEEIPVNSSKLLIKNAQINADKILIKKASATNFKTNVELGADDIFKIKDYGFNLANGTVNGDISYNLKTYEGKATMKIRNADAQIISENFFDLPNQMYGYITADMSASCKGLSSVDCIKTLSGKGNFNVSDGRMPKLGSLEYLLKAGNLITGGITGLSINGIIDLITPLKTGNFSSISGNIKINDGIADSIEVYSKGKDLNMYLSGSYNLQNLVADMEIYGSLSKNFSTLLGKIANSSLNSLFNTIPGININEVNPASTSKINKIPNFDKSNVLRVFKAEIYGDINGSNYVKSFKWVKD